jgi:NifB/MoaA-like Fe-S oxidoreductase
MQKNKKVYYLYKSVQEDNILPITSKCNLSCIFCSHKQNPPGVETIRFGDLSLKKIDDLISYLDPNKPIIIGESATKIIEGEPLVHPEFKKVLTKIRDQYSETKIKITTNADQLDKEMLQFFEDLNNIILNISINYIDPELRKTVMGVNCKGDISKTLTGINKFDIDYHFSMVALPNLFGRDKIKNELKEMVKYNPLSIRVFMPGYTEYTTEKLKFDFDETYDNLRKLVHDLNLEQEIPIVIEPPKLENLKKNIIGIIRNSPADKAGIKYLDEIIKINKKKVVSRVEAFNLIKKSKNTTLTIKRNNKLINKNVIKKSEQDSGLILNYDLSQKKIKNIKRIILENKNKDILFLTSELGYNLINYIINYHLEFENQSNIKVDRVINIFMNGSIISAGLLTNQDINNYLNNSDNLIPELLILPSVMYDIFNNDLCGFSYKNIEKEYKLAIELA